MADPRLPLVSDNRLLLPDGAEGQLAPIVVGSSAWYNWLAAESNQSFAFKNHLGKFTARRERKHQGWYWYAYRKREGKLRKAYLGKTEEMTLERLNAVAVVLAGQSTSNDGPVSYTHGPVESALSVFSESKENTDRFLLAAPSGFAHPHETGQSIKHNLPAQLSSLIGREQAAAAACALLRQPEIRLLTLTGTGGVGKTRLGLRIATDLLDDFAGGVCFISFASISDAGLVVPTIAQTFGLQGTSDQPLLDLLKAYLGGKRLLLLLDNFEQVVTVAPVLVDLLQACPQLKMLVTSRTILHVSGEREFPVPPLTVPDLSHLPENEVLSQYAAVALFLQRAQALKLDFHMTKANARAIAEICVHLDGLPLAIELAAARIKLLSPQALLARLGQRFEVLTSGARDAPARQQTLRNTIAWSYHLLEDQEQRLFRRLSVFVGGCTLQAIEAVYRTLDEGGGVVQVLDGVASLIDKSLLQQMGQEGEEPRLVILETVREYGLERLRESGEAEAIQRAYAMYYLALLEETEPHLKGEQQLVWLKRLEQEAANVFAALEAAFEYGMHTDLMRGVYAFAPFLLLSGAYALAKRHVQRAHEVATALGDHRSATSALLYLGKIAHEQGNYPQSEAYLQEGLTLARQIGDRERISAVLAHLGAVARKRGEHTQAAAYLQEGLTLARRIGNRELISALLASLGAIAANRGDFIQSETYLEEGLILARQIGNRERIGDLLINLAATAGDQGNDAQAEVYLQEGLTLARQMGDREQICLLLLNLGGSAHDQGNDTQAEAYLHEGLTLARQMGYPQWISALLTNLGSMARKQGNYARAEVYLQESLVLARQIGWPRMISTALYEYGFLSLNRQQIEAAEASFREMLTVLPAEDQDLIVLARYGLARVVAARGTIEEARQLGEASLKALETMGHRHAKEVRHWLDSLPVPLLSLLQPHAVVKPPLLRTYPAGLTAREVEVLCLVAQGMTNEQVAEQLVISPRTVNTHLTSIYSKIRVSSRSAATRYAIEQHLV
jgi:predicted ATPase/DNA-binding CsgD family transcriptional regulator